MQKYIVTLKEGTAKSTLDSLIQLVGELGGKVEHVYDTLLTGFSAVLSERALDAVRQSPDVEAVEQDQVVKIC